MIQLFHGAIAAVADVSDRTARPPAPPPVIPSARPFCLPLLPARIDAHGMPVLRLFVEVANRIPCVALKTALDGQMTEEPAEADAFKPHVGVVYETLNPANVCWFHRTGNPVDADSVRSQLNTWRPVLLLPSAKASYFDSAAETLLDCFRPTLLIAVIADMPRSLAERDPSPASKLVSAAPVPTRVRIDEKRRIVFRPASFQANPGQCVQKPCAVVTQKVTLGADELAVDPRHVQFFDTEGNPVEPATATERLAKETTVLVSGDGKMVNDFYLKVVQPDTLICVLPFDLSKACKSPRNVTPAPPS